MSCHSASVRSEVYRIRSVLRECIYIVQTKIADFIDAFWVFKQALRLNSSVGHVWKKGVATNNRQCRQKKSDCRIFPPASTCLADSTDEKRRKTNGVS